MGLQDTLISQLRDTDPHDILSQLGYKKITDKTLARLEALMRHDDLGFSQSYFDFKYDQITFIKAVCEFLQLDFESYRVEVEAIRDEISYQ